MQRDTATYIRISHQATIIFIFFSLTEVKSNVTTGPYKFVLIIMEATLHPKDRIRTEKKKNDFLKEAQTTGSLINNIRKQQTCDEKRD